MDKVQKQKSQQAKTSKKRKAEEEDDERAGAEGPPTDEKAHVNAVVKYVKEIMKAGWKVKKAEDLTEDIKRDFKKPFPPGEECRLNVYWKLSCVGVHLKSEKKDLITVSVPNDAGPYLLRLHSCLKTASLLATRSNCNDITVHQYIDKTRNVFSSKSWLNETQTV